MLSYLRPENIMQPCHKPPHPERPPMSRRIPVIEPLPTLKCVSHESINVQERFVCEWKECTNDVGNGAKYAYCETCRHTRTRPCRTPGCTQACRLRSFSTGFHTFCPACRNSYKRDPSLLKRCKK